MPSAIPSATYRLQLTKDFTFDDATSVVPYLKKLGVTHLYASPFLKARPGSTHGYDIVDHEQLNPELGGEEAFNRLSDTLKQHDLGLILDFVPNHMGVGHADNVWWLDVLEWGPKSPHAASFDIDWEALPHRRHPGVLLPILGKPYGDALQAREIELKFDAATGSFAVWYFDNKLPVNPQRYAEIVRTLVQAAGAADEPAGKELLSLAEDYRDPGAPSYREAPEFKGRLSEIEGAEALLGRGLQAFHGDTDSGTAALHRLLERQHYRLAYWRVAFSAVNYRRFFDINDLAGLRIENPATFRHTHSLIARLIAEGRLQGLRLDHIDGLRDPAQYARRLRRLINTVRDPAQRGEPFYVIVEKILGEDEALPAWTGIAGTTGYEWLNVISQVLVDSSGLDPLEATWRDFTGERADLPAMLDAAKLRVIRTMLASEFTVLAGALSRIAAGHFSTRDYTLDRLRAALQLYVIAFPVYRTYVTAAGPSARDRDTIEGAVRRARARWQGPDPEIFDFLRDAVTLDLLRQPGYSAPRIRNFAFKLQQFTGPLMAKSLEDTTFYRHHRLLALNEVGGSPAAPALTLDDFHRIATQRAETAPDGLTATATHDTKRGEDARARILALSEIAPDWTEAMETWRRLNAPLLRQANGTRAPSAAHEYMLYQALVGAWSGAPDDAFVKRMQAYALKAAREGKQETSWTVPNEDYEHALAGFLGDILDSALSGEFLASFAALAQRTALLGALNGLSQLALKLLMPGVPDIYQGTELWDFSLVDPDNRRPVDFVQREAGIPRAAPQWSELAAHWPDGRVKLALTHALLGLRRDYPALLRRGGYQPVAVTGAHADNVIAFKRTLGRERLIVLIGRHFGALTGGGRQWPAGWQATIPEIGSARLHDLLHKTDRPPSSEIASLLSAIPVSVLRIA